MNRTLAIGRRLTRAINAFFSSRGAPSVVIMLTLEGLLFVALLAGVGFAALNTGVNLLYLVFSVMAALMVVSGLASRRNLRRLRLTRSVPSSAFAGEKTLIRLRAFNGKKLFHSYSLRFTDQDDKGQALGLCYAMRISRSSTVSLDYSVMFERRGRRRLAALTVSSRFPFGFFEKGHVYRLSDEVLVYPRLYPAMAFLESQDVNLGWIESGRKGHGSSLYALRDYTPQDCARLIHWKVSARASKLMAREMESDEERKICLILDEHVEPALRQAMDEPFERAVSCAASVARDLLDRGFRVGLATRSGRIPADQGSAHLRRILGALALVDMRGAPSPPPPMPMPDEGSMALWIDYGADAAAQAKFGAFARRLDARNWPESAGGEWAAERAIA